MEFRILLEGIGHPKDLLLLEMIGQNLQGRHTEMRAEADYEVNTRAEREIETILQHLENQNELILKILQRLEGK